MKILYLIASMLLICLGVMCNGQYPVTKNYPGDTAMIKVGDTSWMNGTPFVLKSTGSDKLNLYWMQVDTFTPKPLKIKMKPRWRDSGWISGGTVIDTSLFPISEQKGRSKLFPWVVGPEYFALTTRIVDTVSNTTLGEPFNISSYSGIYNVSKCCSSIDSLWKYYIQLQKEFMDYKNKHK